MAVSYVMSVAHNCAVYVISLCYIHHSTAYGGDWRAILVCCSNVNKDEKFPARSLQQLQYRATRTALFKKSVNFTRKITLKS